MAEKNMDNIREALLLQVQKDLMKDFEDAPTIGAIPNLTMMASQTMELIVLPTSNLEDMLQAWISYRLDSSIPGKLNAMLECITLMREAWNANDKQDSTG